MKKILFLLVALIMCCTAVNAQTMKELKAQAKERIAMRKLTRKEAEQKCMKEARTQAKALKKEGWKPVAGTESLEKQLNEMLLMQHEANGALPKYIIGRGSAYSNIASMAKKNATTQAYSQIAEQMGIEVAGLVEESSTSMQMSDDDYQNVEKIATNSKQLFQHKIGSNKVVFQAERDKDGKHEISIGISYDGSMAKDAILQAFEKESPELKAKLEEYINSKK